MGPPTGVTGRGASKSPQQSTKQPKRSSPPFTAPTRDDTQKSEESTNTEVSKPLAPPPRPNQQQNSNSPDYFGNVNAASLNLEPNPFEQSFGSAPPETPGGTKLPSVAALTSPSSLLPGNTPFSWGAGSLRTGPLSPAMLSAPTNDYFSDTHHIRGGFPTPNESSLRSGLTPGGSGSMFPAPSPNSQVIFAQLAGGPSATPGTIDFHRTAVSAAAAKREQAQAQQQQLPVAAPTSQPQETRDGAQVPNNVGANPPAGPFDPHDNDAASGLYMLAQGRNTAQAAALQYAAPPTTQVQIRSAISAAPAAQLAHTSPQMNGAPSVSGSSARGASVASAKSDENEVARPNTRARGKRNPGGAAAGTRRKAEDTQVKTQRVAKKQKPNGRRKSSSSHEHDHDMDHSEEDDHDKSDKENGGDPKSKADDEKRKNFLERNRVAALKCRQRKKAWLANLQAKVEEYAVENEGLNHEIGSLREEIIGLKTLLLAHKDCPVSQQQGLSQQQALHGTFMPAPIEAFNNPPMNAYGMAPPPMNGQPVMAGQGIDRRFS
ncbi:Aft1 HRA domain-containing protein [Chaetomium tenue]|uniref:Aft1 HRA domain-containing protein n=1 Tax=Chaetomium tenue TaxID=1854479 RepID=A0ACB7PLS4_9PEZI|nr:Aft1 HRA domain-containing protein [Chaetomium globosum]